MIALCSLLCLEGCNSGSEKENGKRPSTIRQVSRLLTPAVNQQIKAGDSLSVRVELPDSISLDSLQLKLGDSSISLVNGGKFRLPATGRLGTRQYQLLIYADTLIERHPIRLKVLASKPPVTYRYRVVNTFAHNANDFTQGFLYRNDTIYESTGQKGKSLVKKYLLSSGQLLQSVPIDDRYFGEGCTIWNDQLYQLTWQANTGFIYDLSLNLKKKIQYATQGWGVTTVGDTLYMTDGSSTLYLIDPLTFAQIDRMEVYTDKGPVADLNELEYIEGLIYANIWTEDRIVMIDPVNGRVVGSANLSGLLNDREAANADVLNGIAYDQQRKRMFFTGKYWPKTFELELIAN